MAAPTKWRMDFFVDVSGNGAIEPFILASPTGSFEIMYTEDLASFDTEDTDVETRYFNAQGSSSGATEKLGESNQFESSTQASGVFLADGRLVRVWSEKPVFLGGGSGENDLYADVSYVDGSIDIDDFLVAGGVGEQVRASVAAGVSGGFVIALADYNAPNNVTLKFYDTSGSLFGTQTLSTPLYGSPTLSIDELSIIGHSNGNYILAFTENNDAKIAIYSPWGPTQILAPTAVDAGSAFSVWPDVTELANGNILVTYYGNLAVGGPSALGSIFSPSGTLLNEGFEISTDLQPAFEQYVASAALEDGRFVAVWISSSNEVVGQMMFADGTKDGSVFAVSTVNSGVQGRPAIDVLADGRFVVAWETTEDGTSQIKSTIFDPRETGVNLNGTLSNDEFFGTDFDDFIFSGAGFDFISAAGGHDMLDGHANNDLIYAGAGNDTLFGGTGIDTMFGGQGDDIFFADNTSDFVIEMASEGTDFIYASNTYQIAANVERLIAQEGPYGRFGLTARNFQNDIVVGNSESNVFIDQFGRDTYIGGGGADFFRFIANLDPVNNVNRVNDFNSAEDQFQLLQLIYSAIPSGILDASQFVNGAAALDANDRIIYDQSGVDGVVYYDPDGTGAQAQIEIVNLAGNPTISADDFQIY